MDKEFYERQIKRIKERLREHYSNDSNKTIHYFQEKGYLQGLLYAYENIVEENNSQFFKIRRESIYAKRSTTNTHTYRWK